MLVTQKRNPVATEEELELEQLDDVTFDDTDELRKLIATLQEDLPVAEKIALVQQIFAKFGDSPIAQFALENVAENDPSEELRAAVTSLLQSS